jgi:anti-sigma B factor antagonist
MNDDESPAWAESDHEVVAMPGEIDINNSAEIANRLNLALLRGPGLVIADFTATTFSDSSGLRELALARRHAVDMNVELRAVIASPAVLRSFALAGLAEVLPIYASLDAALAGLPVSDDARRGTSGKRRRIRSPGGSNGSGSCR